MPVFISYGNGRFKHSLAAIQQEAKRFTCFERIQGFTPADMESDEEFWSLHGTLMKTVAVGNGFWIWKPYIVLKTLETMQEGDVLVYADAGCILNSQGEPLLQEWIEMAKKAPNGLVFVQSMHTEYYWTKQDLFEKLNCEHLANTKQIMSGVQILCKCDASVNFYKELYTFMSEHSNINGSPSKSPNRRGFKEHRYDQSCLSLLAKLRGCSLITRQLGKSPENPIWTVRRRG